jgi:hypothetical protein
VILLSFFYFNLYQTKSEIFMKQKRPKVENLRRNGEVVGQDTTLIGLLADHADTIATLPVFGGN